MANSNLKYLIAGTGGVGGSIAAFLSLSGKDVTCIARGEHLAAIRGTRLHLHSDPAYFRYTVRNKRRYLFIDKHCRLPVCNENIPTVSRSIPSAISEPSTSLWVTLSSFLKVNVTAFIGNCSAVFSSDTTA